MFLKYAPTVVIKSSTFNDLNWFSFLNKYKSVVFVNKKGQFFVLNDFINMVPIVIHM